MKASDVFSAMEPRRFHSPAPAFQPPSAWLDELASGDGFDTSQEFVCRLPADQRVTLSFFPETFNKIGARTDQLQEELAGRVHPRRVVRPDTSVCYVLDTRHLSITVFPQTGRNTGATMMCVGRVVRKTDPALREGAMLADFVLSEGWHEAAEDLDALCRYFRVERDRWRQERARRLERARGLLTESRQPPGDVERHVFRELLQRKYAPLQAMLAFLEKRAEIEGAAQASGEIEAPPPPSADGEPAMPVFAVRITAQQGDFEDGDRVILQSREGGEPLRARLEESEGGRFSFRRTRHSERLKPGETVEIQRVPRFQLRSHFLALSRFLSGETEGEWLDLARLMFRPRALTQPTPPPMPTRWYAEEDGRTQLNDEQKQAVAGALGTPHAFFIQGPPGTGKTTVIAEVIRHLVARGERVLMLAPTHVAVDAVLLRVGGKEGVRPLRLAWDETPVNEETRRYLPHRARRELAEKIRPANRSRAEEWQARKEKRTAQAVRIGALLAACRRKREADNAADRVRAAWEAHKVQAIQQNKTLRISMEETEAACLPLGKRRVELTVMERRERRQLDKMRGEATFLEKTLALVGQGTLAAVEKQWKQTHTALVGAEKEAGLVFEQYSAAQKAWNDSIREGEEKAAQFGRESTHTEEERAAATAEWQKIAPAEPSADLALEETLLHRHAEIVAELRRLEFYPELEAQWFETSGLADREGREGVQRLAAEIGDELLETANVFCCTTTGIAGDPTVRERTFDTLIVDEASRVTDAEFLIGAVRARRWILVGDEKQLPPYVEPADEHHLHALAALHRAGGKDADDAVATAVAELADLWQEEEETHQYRRETVTAKAGELLQGGHWSRDYRKLFGTHHQQLGDRSADADRTLLTAMRDYLVRSLFERCVARCSPASRQRLTTQRRMIEPLARLVEQPIYGGNYLSPDAADLIRAGVMPLTIPTFPKPVTFMDTSRHGERAFDRIEGSGFVAPLEADWIARACEDFERELRQRNSEPITVSVLCFYRAQAQAIRQRLGGPNYGRFHRLNFQVIDAIDKIQGQESDLVFVSFGRVHGQTRQRRFGQWLQDLRRLNVACTRAHRAMVFVGHRPTLAGLYATEESRAFYAHFFDLFAKWPDDMQIIENYGGGDKQKA